MSLWVRCSTEVCERDGTAKRDEWIAEEQGLMEA